MATGDRKDPMQNHNFRLEIDGIQRAGFRECKGIDSTTEAVKYREGTDKTNTSRQLPGMWTPTPLVLTGGIISGDDSVSDWYKKTEDGKVERKNGSVCLLDESGDEKLRWNFVSGWPSKYEVSGFNATANEVVVETLTIVHEGITKA
jgi:phage tail-like protein